MPYRTAPKNTEYTPGELAWFRKPFHVLLLTLVGCVRLAHVEPDYRDAYDRAKAIVKIEAYCGDDIIMSEDHLGTGVVISERHVLTAYHVVECPFIPNVHITTSTGERHRAVVIEEDPEHDIAKLEILHAGRLGLDIAPPMLAPAWWGTRTVCAYVLNRPPVCGPQDHPSIVTIQLEHGDSGAAVYDDAGRLVGLVRSDIHWISVLTGESLYHETRVTTVSPQWMNGT